MGGLRKFMPITAATFIVGWLAIAGVPPFAGLLVEGRHPSVRLGKRRFRCEGALGNRARDRTAHRLLHEPPGLHGVLRRAALERGALTGRRGGHP